MKVKFVPQNVEFEIKPGEPVLHVAQDHGIYIKSVCKGVPNCAECRIRIIDGEHNVLPPGTEELSLIGSGYFIDRRRLSCQLKCFGDIVIDMTEQIQKEQGLIGGRKTKKLQAKDDRVEAVVARRGEDNETPEGTEPGAEAEESSPAAQSSEQSARSPVEQRPRPPQPQRDRPPQREREPRRDQSDRQMRPPGQGQQRPQGPRPQGPRPPNQQGEGDRPQGAEGGEGGPRRRRRRRGGKGRGGGGGSGGGGAPPQG
ncbi:MAG: 2Fe-2S iron-sulfur cluster-binding protein [Bdellovibrionota bacterium]